jgi:hypothetical protein
MKLFICHAWEDKMDFVEPLADALRQDFEVWYDKFQLTLGDSLLQQITEGLRSCDFGVVVLSKAFFAKKKWTENELAGLFALETTARKIILPIWKDVTAEEVRSYSAILADRFAVSASQGLSTVVAEITIAVSISERKDELAREDSAKKVKALVETLTERKDAERLIYSEEGAQIVSKKFDELCSEIQRIIESGVGTSDVIKFRFGRPMRHVLYVNTRFGMHLGLGLQRFYENSVSDALLAAKVFKRQFGAFGEPHGDGEDLDERAFKPSFRRGEVIWISDDENKHVFGTGELAQYLVDTFIEYVCQQANVV